MQIRSGADGIVRRAPSASVVLITVWVLTAVYLWWILPLGWIPHDDGALAQAADWVNHGLLPHRDFVDLYTGGLSELHAFAFRLLGTRLFTLRVVLFVAFLAWVPAVFYIASRLARPIAAGIVSLLAIVWSVPNYPASMPSWYNLFFACFGVAALFRFIETRRARWLFAAGIAGGLSILVKVIGLYFVAGVLLFLVFETQVTDDETAPVTEEHRATAYSAFVSLCLAVFALALAVLIRRAFRPGEFMQFVVPGTTIAAFVCYNEWRTRSAGSVRRFQLLLLHLSPFVAGVALPVVVFLIPYVRTSSVDALIYGVFTLPMQRLSFATQPAIFVRNAWPLLLVVAWIAIDRYVPTIHRQRLLLLLGGALAVLLVAAGSSAPAYRFVWNAARSLMPVLAVAGFIVLVRRRPENEPHPEARERVVALLSVTAVCTLVQFPYASSIYLYYITPLIALSAFACLTYITDRHHSAAGVLAGFLIAFAVAWNNVADTVFTGVQYKKPAEFRMLDDARGGVAIPIGHAVIYEPLLARLSVVAKGRPIWAYADMPEVYFLSGLPGIGRSPFEFFDPREMDETRIIRSIDSLNVSAVVISTNPPFSPLFTESLYKQLGHRFPLTQKFGPFLLLWHP